MVEAIRALSEIDRKACRQNMETRFSEDVMVDHYLHIHEDM